MSQTCTLGIDIGTTSVKVVAFTPDGREITRAGLRLNTHMDGPGWVEQDAIEVQTALETAMLRVLETLQEVGKTVGRVGFSAAMHSLLAIDDHGRPLTNAMTWMDSRASEEANHLWEAGSGRELYAATGAPIHPMTPLLKLMWLRKHSPDLVKKAHKFVSLKEWIWHYWFGVWEIDASMAGATGLFNVHTHQWDPEALDVAGISDRQLSAIVPTSHIRRGLRAQRLLSAGLCADTPFNVGASDGVLANLGAGVVDSKNMVITIGTSCAIRVGSQAPVTDVKTRTFCYVLGPDKYVVGGPSNSGGVVVDWLYRQVIGEDGAAMGSSSKGSSTSDGSPVDQSLGDLLTAAEHVETEGLICLPYVSGERAPIWNPDAKAAFIGLQLSHSKLHMLRSAIEGILMNAHAIASSLMVKVGTPHRVVASGKLLEVPWIRQLTADIFGLPVTLASTADASVVGAVVLAELAMGDYSWDYLPQRLVKFQSPVEDEVVYPSTEAHAKYEQKATEFWAIARALTIAST